MSIEEYLIMSDYSMLFDSCLEVTVTVRVAAQWSAEACNSFHMLTHFCKPNWSQGIYAKQHYLTFLLLICHFSQGQYICRTSWIVGKILWFCPLSPWHFSQGISSHWNPPWNPWPPGALAQEKAWRVKSHDVSLAFAQLLAWRSSGSRGLDFWIWV